MHYYPWKIPEKKMFMKNTLYLKWLYKYYNLFCKKKKTKQKTGIRGFIAMF